MKQFVLSGIFSGPEVKRTSPHSRGFLFAGLGVLLVTTNFVTVKFALKRFNPETFTFLWTSSAAGYALLLLVIGGQGKSIFLPMRRFWWMALIGVINGAGALLTWKGLAYLDPSIASFLWRFHPIITILLGVVFLQERFMLVELFPVGLMIVGAFFSLSPKWQSISTGVIITLFACTINSVQMYLVKIKVSEYRPELIVFYRNAIGALIIGVWVFMTRMINIQIEGGFYWMIALVGSLFGEALSFTFLFKSFSYWDLSRTSVIRTAEPLLVLLWGYLVFHSLPGSTELLGGLLILCGAVLFSLCHFFRKPVRSQ